MAGGKLSPRQKMINMMYLVLTALLAMNVSKEILNSFALLNNGLVKTNENFTAKNEVTYANFENALLTDPKKVRPFLDKANAVKLRSKEMFSYIEGLKNDLIKEVEEKDKTVILGRNGQDSTISIASNIMYMEGKDNNQIPTHFFMGDADNAAPGNKAFEFKDKVNKFKEDLKTFIPAKERNNIKLGLETGNVFSPAEKMMVSWENNNFYHNPAVAVIAILTKMQNEVKNAEADIINALYNEINVNSYKFDTLSARVNATSNYVLIGDDYKAEIYVAGFSTTSNPQIWLGEYDSTTNSIKGPIDSTSVKVENGVGILTKAPETEGTTELTGIIRVKNPADPKAPPKVFPFHSQYKSAKPAVVVSPEKMNVFYRGLENPVAISVPGVAAEDLVVGMSGGGGSIVKKSNGEYIVKVFRDEKCTINVSARTSDGTVRPMGKGMEFRIKQVPKPLPSVYGKIGSDVIRQGELPFVKCVIADLKDFVMNVPFPVMSCEVSMNVNGITQTVPGTGTSLSFDQQALIKKARRRDVIFIDKIKVKMPDGTIQDIGSPVVLKVI
jgi:gliding motility-associated protein GldM